MTTSAEIRQHLVDALRIDLIGPSWDDVARRHEQINQPPSVRYTTGFLVPHVFQQEAGRTTKEEQLSFSDLAGEEPSNDASSRLEKQEKEDDADGPDGRGAEGRGAAAIDAEQRAGGGSRR